MARVLLGRVGGPMIHLRGERMEEAYKRRAFAMAEDLHKAADNIATSAEREDFSKLITIGLDVISFMPRYIRQWRTIERRKS